MRKRGKTDGNQADIVSALRQVGAHVTILSNVGGGVPDLLVARHGKLFLVECKSETGKLTADELAYVNEISRVALVAVRIVRSPEAALRAIDAI